MATYQGESEMARLLRGREERLRMPESGPGPEEAVRLAGEAETEVRVLAGAAACGLRAARWIRGLPLAPDSWTVRTVADAVEEATAALDPRDRDDVGRTGHGGIPESVRTRLDGLPYAVAETVHLAPAERVALFAVVGCVLGMGRILANDPWTAVHEGELAALCATVDAAVLQAPHDASAPVR